MTAASCGAAAESPLGKGIFILLPQKSLCSMWGASQILRAGAAHCGATSQHQAREEGEGLAVAGPAEPAPFLDCCCAAASALRLSAGLEPGGLKKVRSTEVSDQHGEGHPGTPDSCPPGSSFLKLGNENSVSTSHAFCSGFSDASPSLLVLLAAQEGQLCS